MMNNGKSADSFCLQVAAFGPGYVLQLLVSEKSIDIEENMSMQKS
jgi:hypothetical protein